MSSGTYAAVKRWRAKNHDKWMAQCKRNRQKHRDVRNAAKRRYYAKYPEKIKQQRLEYRQRKQQVYDSLKLDGCSQCGEKDVRCLEWHHIIPVGGRDKRIPINSTLSLEKLVKTLDGCILLCANCHAKSHRPLSYAKI